MGPLAGDKELGVLALGVQGAGSDDAPGQVQRLQQRYFAGRTDGLRPYTFETLVAARVA